MPMNKLGNCSIPVHSEIVQGTTLTKLVNSFWDKPNFYTGIYLQ